jgi:hypothetical protein
MGTQQCRWAGRFSPAGTGHELLTREPGGIMTAARVPEVRTGQTDVKLSRAEFGERFRERFYDPAFEEGHAGLNALEETAWEAYDEYRKSPRTRPAGAGFEDPDFELPVEWLAARQRVLEAEQRQRRRAGRGCWWCAHHHGPTRRVPARCPRRFAWLDWRVTNWRRVAPTSTSWT